MIDDKELARSLLAGMKRIRIVEEGIAERYPTGKMRCPTHLSIGQEAAAVGVGHALEHTDLAVSTHRAHAHYLAKGGDVKAMLAEIYGKATGCARGRGGSMHLIDTAVGFMGSTAIVANSIPLGVGLALSLKLKNSSAISVAFFGDGATEEGAFYESVNFAAVRRLPVLFVCENNLYSVYSPLSVRQPEGREVCKVVEAMGITAERTDGNDPLEVHRAARAAVAAIREGRGPHLLELMTYRWREHCGPHYDNDLGYRTEDEFASWKARDPVAVFEQRVQNEYGVPESEICSMTRAILTEVEEAFVYAEESPFPDASEALTGLFRESES